MTRGERDGAIVTIQYHWLKNYRLLYVREWGITEVAVDGSPVAHVSGRNRNEQRTAIDQGHHEIEIRSCLGVRDRRRVGELGELLWRGDISVCDGDAIRIDVYPARQRGFLSPFRPRASEAVVRISTSHANG